MTKEVGSASLRGARWTAASTILGALLQAGQLWVASRMVPPERFGLLALVTIVIGLGKLYADLGINQSIIRRQDSTLEQLSSLYWLNLASGGLATLLVLAAAPAVAWIYGQPALAPLVGLASPVFLASAFGQQYQVLLQRELRFRPLALIDMTALGSGTALSIVGLILGWDVYALVLGTLCTATLRSAALLAIGIPEWRPRWTFHGRAIGDHLAFGLYNIGQRTVTYLSGRLDQLIIGAVLGPTILGYYGFAYSIAVDPLYAIVPIFTNVAFPVLAKVQSHPERLKQGYLATLRLVLTIIYPVLIGIAAVAPTAVPILFGETWQPAVPIVIALALTGIIRTFGNPLFALFAATGQLDRAFYWNLGLFALQLPVLYGATRFFGVLGSLSALFTLTLVNVVGLYGLLVPRVIRLSIADLARVMLPPLAIAAAMMALVVSLPRLWASPSPAMLEVQIAAGALFYAATTLLLRREDVRAIWAGAS